MGQIIAISLSGIKKNSPPRDTCDRVGQAWLYTCNQECYSVFEITALYTTKLFQIIVAIPKCVLNPIFVFYSKCCHNHFVSKSISKVVCLKESLEKFYWSHRRLYVQGFKLSSSANAILHNFIMVSEISRFRITFPRRKKSF